MQSQNSDPPNWSPLEIKLFNTIDVFAHKPAIIKKAEDNLTLLKQTIVKELANGSHPCPPETDTIKGQIVRGENHKGFPFISLDMPQMFSKTQMFTFRTLFWWGHYLIFSLILKQNDLTSIANNLILLKESQKNQVLIINYEEFFSNPSLIIKKLSNFLNTHPFSNMEEVFKREGCPKEIPLSSRMSKFKELSRQASPKIIRELKEDSEEYEFQWDLEPST